MYSITDYLRSGFAFANNALRPRHKRLTSLMLYATTRCQSRCKHCNIWQKPHEHLGLEDIRRLMASRCITKHTVVGLEGGEFLLHPEAEDILSWFDEHHPNYTLLSNCLAPQRVIRAVQEHHPCHLYVSFDGPRETYRKMRGVDGHDKVIEVVEACRDIVPTSLMFCLSPWNSFEDMAYVIDIAKKYNVDVRIGIYGTLSFFDTTSDLLLADAENFLEQIPASIHSTQENYDFVALYDEWRNGHLRLRCHSIFSQLVIHSNGDVPLCQNLGVVLGNIHERSLDDILRAPATCAAQSKYSHNCNACWINYHRKFDIILLRNLERLLPRWIIRRLYGPYQWSKDKRESYRQCLRRLSKKTM